MKRLLCFFICFFVVACLCGCEFSFFDSGSNNILPENEIMQNYEMRAAWIATVWQLDFPDFYTTNSDLLKNQIDALVCDASQLNLTDIFFQVRPCCDSFYKSQIFPWSRFISGTQGDMPTKNFDPLEYIIEKSHSHNIKLHAWINPYRVQLYENEPMAIDNPARNNPGITMVADGKIMLNPGEPDARNLIKLGVLEIIENYDVDGIHFDDYFYPDGSFDDFATYNKYEAEQTSISDWRRHNNNLLISDVYHAIKQTKPHIEFGVSCVGIWENKASHPDGSNTNGYAGFSAIFADSKAWVECGVVDYIMPQVYFYIGQSGADYREIVSWWNNIVDNTNVKLYIGLAGYKLFDASHGANWQNLDEIAKQLEFNATQKNVAGFCVFRFGDFYTKPELTQIIKQTSNNYVDKSTKKQICY